MDEATHPVPEQFRLALANGETIELDGGVLRLDGEEASASVVLRLAPWRAQSLSYVLQEWSVVSRLFSPEPRRSLDELELSRMLVIAAAAAEGSTPELRAPRGGQMVPARQRVAALEVLAEREQQMPVLSRVAVVDAAAWWLSDDNGGQDLAYALLGAACSGEVSAEHAYLALISPDDQSEGLPS
jgi:hypothetical protein